MNKVVLITGASSGIGASTALLFASKNYQVAINYNTNKEKAEELKTNLEKKYHGKYLTIKADISKEEEIISMINKVKEYFGKIDVLVNNAAISMDCDFSQKTKENFKKIIDVNLIGAFLVSKYASVYMDKDSSIINVTSTNGIDSYYQYSMDYDASKAALNILTKDLAIELAPIRVNAVAPGWVNTEIKKELDPDYIKEECQKIICKRFAEPREIANVIYFLASKESSYINGSIIVADGGRK